MKKKIISLLLLGLFWLCTTLQITFAWPNSALDKNVNITNLNGNKGSTENFKLLEETIDPIKEHLDTSATANILKYWGVDGIVIFIIDLFKTYIFPLIIVLAILTSIFGFMKIMISDDEGERKKWINYFIWWIIGIIVFISAEFIFNGLYGIINQITQDTSWTQSRAIFAEKAYNEIIYPFINLAMYLLMAALFIILLIKCINYITDPTDKAVDQGKNIIISAALWIVIITLAKTLVEAVYSKQTDIKNSAWTFVWKWILWAWPDQYQIIFNIINYVLWLTAFFMVCFIIYQWYLMLFNTNTDDSIKKMRKNLLYIFWWLLLIGLSYLIVNLVALDL